MRKDDGTKLPGYVVSSEKTAVRFVDCAVRHGVRISGNPSVFCLLVKGNITNRVEEQLGVGILQSQRTFASPFEMTLASV